MVYAYTENTYNPTQTIFSGIQVCSKDIQIGIGAERIYTEKRRLEADYNGIRELGKDKRMKNKEKQRALHVDNDSMPCTKILSSIFNSILCTKTKKQPVKWNTPTQVQKQDFLKVQGKNYSRRRVKFGICQRYIKFMKVSKELHRYLTVLRTFKI